MNGENCTITRPELVRVGDETVLRLGAEHFEYDADMEEAVVPKAMLKGFRLSDIPKELTIKAVEDHGVINHDDFALSFADGSASAWVELSERRKLWDGEIGLLPYMEAFRRTIRERNDTNETDFSDDGDYVFLRYEIRIAEDAEIQDAISHLEATIKEIEQQAEQLAQRTLMEKWQGAPKARMVQVGAVAVDSGQIIIVDPCREIKHEDATRHLQAVYEELRKLDKCSIDDTARKQVIDIVNANRTQQITDEKGGATTWGEGAPLAVVSSSGFGDGTYPVYAEIVDCGVFGPRVAKLTIDFELGPMGDLFVEMCQRQAREAA